MIESIAIRNFQIHRKTVLEFDPALTVITGTSDNGKSSIIRAFRWVFQNRPTGFSFKRWGTPEKALTSVDVVIDGETVSRKRGKVRNEYVFDETTFKALRSDVPGPIQEHLKILPFNIQLQSGKAFFFEDSDSEVAKQINEVSGISIIDDILKESNRRLRELNSEEKLLNGIILDKKAQANSLRIFVALNKRVRAANVLHKEAEEKETLLSDVEETIEQYIDLLQKRKKLPNQQKLLKKIAALESQANRIERNKSTVADLEEFIETLESSEVIDPVEIKKLVRSVIKLEKQAMSLEEKHSLLFDLEECVESFDSLASERRAGKRELKALLERYDKTKEECGVCPLCEKEW